MAIYRQGDTDRSMAVKFEFVQGRSTSSPLLNEEINLSNLWKANSNLQHVPRYYGSFVLPVKHIKMECMDGSLEDHIKETRDHYRP